MKNTADYSKIVQDMILSLSEVGYKTPSEYVKTCWDIYQNSVYVQPLIDDFILSHILAALCIKEDIIPVHIRKKPLSGPNVIYDLMFYTAERGPICWSVKTSLRERYKQADLESIALKYVHRKALSYLITLEKNEAKSVKAKIKTGDVIGLDEVIVATEPEFDLLVAELKKYQFEEPPTVQVISSNQVVTAEKVALLKNQQ